MELGDLRGIGPKRLDALHAAGIVSLRDLLYTVPCRYRDMGVLTCVADARNGAEQAFCLQKRGTPKVFYHGKLARVTCALGDDTGVITGCWFNQPWMRDALSKKDSFLLYGRVERTKSSVRLMNPRMEDSVRIVPVYRAIEGIPNKTRENFIHQALACADNICAETLPEAVLKTYDLMSSADAVRVLHQPDTMAHVAQAQRRIAFEQLLLYQIAVRQFKHRRHEGTALPIPRGAEEAFWHTLPFSPTAAQRRTLLEITADLRRPTAMARMVQGDVGCGKTAIAFGAMALCAKAGVQSAFMAPTELLARQHIESAKQLLAPQGIRCGLLLSGMPAPQRRDALAAIQSGHWQVVIGTHALISEGVQYHNLGLCITDEQHRFGVGQRTRLIRKGSGTAVPHLLVMSATPIPRSLALMMYGDLDVSVVDQLPPGRTPVITRIVRPEKRGDMYHYLRNELEQGHQAYIVCPLIEEDEGKAQLKAVESLHQTLAKGVLKGIPIGITHGRQPSAEKAEVLDAFAGGRLQVLIATTVIEVGMNVPNATLMIIEDAERYGLAQLHQLRGRVGRGSQESRCFLVGQENERLRALTHTNDGFEIARKDLELRGPGELLGTQQHGAALWAGSADLMNVKLVHDAAACAQALAQSEAGTPAYRALAQQAETLLRRSLRDVSVS
ncbi:MAG TPA: ATP-dependent DNA helicase RecG [Candidatus Limiplasma sp.]|nr:ATP-dependent DNA helicase RecG [Candidatus Limiplasma sp.]